MLGNKLWLSSEDKKVEVLGLCKGQLCFEVWYVLNWTWWRLEGKVRQNYPLCCCHCPWGHVQWSQQGFLGRIKGREVMRHSLFFPLYCITMACVSKEIIYTWKQGPDISFFTRMFPQVVCRQNSAAIIHRFWCNSCLFIPPSYGTIFIFNFYLK